MEHEFMDEVSGIAALNAARARRASAEFNQFVRGLAIGALLGGGLLFVIFTA